MSGRRAFGSIRKARSGRFEVRYTGPDGGKYTAGRSFVRKVDASAFLAHVEAEISEGTWVSPKESRERERAQEVAAERAAITFAAWSATVVPRISARRVSSESENSTCPLSFLENV